MVEDSSSFKSHVYDITPSTFISMRTRCRILAAFLLSALFYLRGDLQQRAT